MNYFPVTINANKILPKYLFLSEKHKSKTENKNQNNNK